MSIHRRLAAPYFRRLGFNRTLDCGVDQSNRSMKPVLFSLFFGLATLVCGSSKPAVSENQSAREIVDATGYRGTVLVFSLSEQTYVAGHSELVDESFLPASTFKIFSSLVALETGVIADETSVIRWDGVERDRTELNQDLDLQSSFRVSAVPHFQELVRRVGEERMQHYLDLVGYGNQTISGGADQFWLSGGLRISPLEQVDFLVRLYDGDLPFRPEVLASLKEMMLVEETNGAAIRAKTGWAKNEGQDDIGWWVGWMETRDDVRFFATVLTSGAPKNDFGPSRLAVTRKVLAILDGQTGSE